MPLELKLDVSWRLDADGSLPVPELLFELLRQIDRFGSISAAARHCNISYRNAWNLVNRWRDRLGAPLIIPRQGQGARLDEMGRKLLWARDYAREQSRSQLQSAEELICRELEAVADGPAPEAQSLRVYASHCLSHPVLADILERDFRVRSRITHGGSARCLQHLRTGDCDAAGFHLAEGALAEGFIRHYLRFFTPADCRVIHAVRRRQGLIVKPGNPRNIAGVEDLARDDVRFVNRQANSGTRMLLDLLLEDRSIDNARIQGYDHIEFTHSAVSALVASDSVDVGIGMETAAVAHDLDFIPLASEVYFYAVRRREWQHPSVRALRDLLAGQQWREAISAMDGFDVADAGRSLDAEELVVRGLPGPDA